MKDRVNVSIIAAKAKDWVIGANGTMPWKMPSDLKYFREKTMGKPVLMGRKTWESLGNPLRGRTNMVLTRNNKYKADGALVFTSVEQMLSKAKEIARGDDVDEVMIIGGGEIYSLFLPFANKIYITNIYADVEGDIKFPKVRFGKSWRLEKTENKTRRAGDQYQSERKEYIKVPDLFDICDNTFNYFNDNSKICRAR